MASEGANRTRDQPAFDFRLVSDILMQYNVTRKNTRMYPKGHPQLEASFERVCGLLERHFVHADDLGLAITGDSIMIGEYALPRNNPIFRELAQGLHEQSVYSLVMEKGVTADELQATNRVLMGEEGWATPGRPLNEQLARHGVQHVRVSTLEWSESDFTMEEEVDLGDEDAAPGTVGASWESFVRHLLSRESDADEVFVDSDDGIELANVDPEVLAEFVKKLEQKKDMDLSYDKVVARYVSQQSGAEAGMSRVRDTEVRADFARLVEDLHTGLRADLLSKEFNFSKRSPEATLDLLNTSRGRAVVKVLGKMNRAGRNIDPQVLELVDKLARYDNSGVLPDRMYEEMTPAEEARFITHVEGFLASTRFRAASDATERKNLAQYTHADIIADMGPQMLSESISDLVDTVSSEVIARHQASALLDLLERAADEKAAEIYARAAADFIAVHTLDGSWSLVLDVWKELDVVADRVVDKRPMVASMCDKIKLQFWRPENVNLISEAILAYGVDKVGALVDILRHAGPRFAEELVEALAEETEPRVVAVLADVVSELGEAAKPHVLRKLGDEDWEVVRNMLHVLQRAEDDSETERVEELLRHPEGAIRVEALRTLLIFGHEDSKTLLLEAMEDRDEDAALEALALAGYMPDPDIVKALVRVVKGKAWKNPKKELERQRKAVESLARIGSEYGLLELYDIATSRRLVNAREFERLRQDIFKSLYQYDSDVVDQFIEYGKKSRDSRIREITQSLEFKQKKRKRTGG
ncbi:MAG: HEAT repeat domain-containing protein [Desulfatibacillaceae bacterium]